jgi:hypothetical protein
MQHVIYFVGWVERMGKGFGKGPLLGGESGGEWARRRGVGGEGRWVVYERCGGAVVRLETAAAAASASRGALVSALAFRRKDMKCLVVRARVEAWLR